MLFKVADVDFGISGSNKSRAAKIVNGEQDGEKTIEG
jgi:hypothetical protein